MGLQIIIKGGLALFGILLIVLSMLYRIEYEVDKYAELFWVGILCIILSIFFTWYGGKKAQHM